MYNYKAIFVVVGLLATLRGSSGGNVEYNKEYGQNCGDSAICSTELSLTCQNNTCACRLGSFYEKNKCVAIIGATCRSPGFGGMQAVNISCPTTSICGRFSQQSNIILPKSIKKILSLFENMTEEHYGCQCAKGHTPDPQRRTCIPTMEYGKPCSKKPGNECDGTAGLVCGKEGKCGCHNADGIYYDKNMRKCVKKLGVKCNDRDQCEDGKICSVLLAHYRVGLGGGKAEYERGLNTLAHGGGESCVCPPGTIPNSKGNCVGNYRVSCTEDAQCHTEGFLSCIDSICQCEHGMSAVYESGNGGSCRIQVGRACTEKGPKCIGNATCTGGHCNVKCGDTQVSTPLGTCLQNYGKPCDVAGGKFCNNFRGLACTKSKCGCFDSSLTWNKKTEMCAAKEGGACGKFKFSKADLNAISTSDPIYALSTAGVELYITGCEENFKCQPDEVLAKKICKK